MRIQALVKRIVHQMLRDKRALAMMMVAPLLILTLLHYLLASNTVEPRLGVVNADASLIEQLGDKDIKVIQYENVKDTEKTMLEDDLDGFLDVKNDTYSLTLTNTQPTAAKALQIKVKQSIAAIHAEKQADDLSVFIEKVQNTLQGVPLKLESVKTPDIHTNYIYGNADSTFFDQLSGILVGYFVFFFVFLISGIALLKERTTGTLDRLMSTPIQRREIVFGYLLGYGIFAIIQTVIVAFFSVKVLDIVLVGSFWNVIIINMMLALVALSLGTLLSAFANSEFQMMQFIPIVIVPQVFFAGILPVDEMAGWLQIIAKFMPMYYGGDALVDVMYKGLGFSDIKYDLLILFGFALAFIILNIVALKKYRKI